MKLKLGQEVDINKVDSTIAVAGKEGKLGKLVFSKGSVEWWPANNSVNCLTFSWEQLAKVLEKNGTPKKVPKTKSAGKSAAPAKAKTDSKA
ncbi:hypothetical protein HF313_19855 [Massilia atriviolacea]|uniref:hypothetical protein n=1 Tax=Massilia atriviolacea TaxID=2495579 RepID=UPI0013E0E0D6|nr:hypothetical protein [Massilia atriviolacea]